MRLILGLLLALFAGNAFAQSAGPTPPCVTVTFTNPSGQTQTACYPVSSDHPLPVTGSSGGGGQTSFAANDVPTIATGDYVEGNCISGFRAVAVATTNGQNGTVAVLTVSSNSGVTGSIAVFMFDSDPSASTCTSQGSFVLDPADVPKILITSSFVNLSPNESTPSQSSLQYTVPVPFIAGGSSSSGVKTIYYALVAGGAFTFPSANDLSVRIGGSLY